MDFICPTCGMKLPRDLLIVIPHTEEHIVNEIGKRHPDWATGDGICRKCYDYYKEQMRKK